MPLTKVRGSGIGSNITIDSTGIGVNNTDPLYPLHVTEPSGGDTAGIFIDGPSNGNSVLYMGDGDDIDVGNITYNHSDNRMSLNTNAGERVRINSSGNVAMGATALSLNAPNLLTVRNSSNGNEADVMLGNQTIRRGFVGINSSETRYFKCISYSSGNMFTGDIKMFINRGGGFNQTQGFRHYNCSLAGYNNTLRGFATDSGDSGTQGVAEIYLGSDEGIYIKVSSSIYGGDVFFTFEGSGSMTWVFNIGTYVTSAP